MAFRTKGWRRLVIDGRVFFWKPDRDGWSDLFEVRPEAEPRRHLRVFAGRCGDQSDKVVDIATPGLARVCIKSAVKAGWAGDRPIMQVVSLQEPRRGVALTPTWRTSTVVAVAAGIIAERAFDRLPILADALQDAGCEDGDVLTHCRSGGPHAFGCWVVDLILTRR